MCMYLRKGAARKTRSSAPLKPHSTNECSWHANNMKWKILLEVRTKQHHLSIPAVPRSVLWRSLSSSLRPGNSPDWRTLGLGHNIPYTPGPVAEDVSAAWCYLKGQIIMNPNFRRTHFPNIAESAYGIPCLTSRSVDAGMLKPKRPVVRPSQARGQKEAHLQNYPNTRRLLQIKSDSITFRFAPSTPLKDLFAILTMPAASRVLVLGHLYWRTSCTC